MDFKRASLETQFMENAISQSHRKNLVTCNVCLFYKSIKDVSNFFLFLIQLNNGFFSVVSTRKSRIRQTPRAFDISPPTL